MDNTPSCPEPTPSQLRRFAFSLAVALPVGGWMWGANGKFLGGLAVAGVILAVIGLLAPGKLRRLFAGWTTIAAPVRRAAQEMALLAIFYGVVWPLGWMLRLARHNAISRRIDRTAPTYWARHAPPGDAASYLRQYSSCAPVPARSRRDESGS